MAAIVLGKKPANFKPFTIKFELPEGGEGKFEVTFKYRSRSEFGDMMNLMFADAGEEKTTGTPDFKELFAKMGDKNADHLQAALTAWGLDFEPSRENLLALCDQYPAAGVAMMHAYRDACVEGRLGN